MAERVEDRSWVSEFYDSAADGWGYSWYEGENLRPRLAKVQRFAGAAPKNLLELGAGTGETAAYLAAAGYTVTAVDISARNYALLSEVAARCPGMTVLRGDFYTVAIPGRFDAVCLFETFGLGADAASGACCAGSPPSGSRPEGSSSWMSTSRSAPSARRARRTRSTGSRMWRDPWP